MVVKEAIANECPWGHASNKERISEGTCTHMRNGDPARRLLITFGRCIAEYCPIELEKLSYKK